MIKTVLLNNYTSVLEKFLFCNYIHLKTPSSISYHFGPFPRLFLTGRCLLNFFNFFLFLLFFFLFFCLRILLLFRLCLTDCNWVSIEAIQKMERTIKKIVFNLLMHFLDWLSETIKVDEINLLTHLIWVIRLKPFLRWMIIFSFSRFWSWLTKRMNWDASIF